MAYGSVNVPGASAQENKDLANAALDKLATLTIPTQSGTTPYTGQTQKPAWNGYDPNKMTLGGTTSGTNAGSYTATFAPKTGYKWSDGTTAAKSVTWLIEKAAGRMSLSAASLTLDVFNPTQTVQVTRDGNGAITASSSNPSVATAKVSGATVTVTGIKTGSATITVSVAAGTNHTAVSATFSVAVERGSGTIYGAAWDGTSTTKWTRTDGAAAFVDPVPYVAGATNYSSPFDNISPWKDMVKEERTGGTMVKIPKFWYQITQNGKGMTIRISNAATQGFHVSPAHMDRGDGKGERDVVYIGRYHCAASNYKSKTGETPKDSITRATARTEIHKLGTNIWQSDFAMRFTLWLLYIVEFADWNSQKTIGNGCGDNSNTGNMGYTDSMPYHTGTTQASRNTYGLGTQYRNIEGLWDNVCDWCDGCYNSGTGLNMILNPAKFSDTTGGAPAGIPSSRLPTAFAVTDDGGFPMFLPTAASGSDTTYSCDFWYFVTSSPCVFVGGYYHQDRYYGLFYVHCYAASSAFNSVGSRLQELP